MKRFLTVILILTFLIIPGFALAHPGKLDSRGGHICRTNCEKWGYKYGEWHQHQKLSDNKRVKVKSKIKSKSKAKTQVKTKVGQKQKK